tara:strand:+ start:399 stop:1082 length:684 start_codon:yes stop_codon:yes gene_type:complete
MKLSDSNIEKFEDEISYKFNNVNILITALTHKSIDKKESKNLSNQRFEFLGDAVLELIVTRYLFDTYPQMEEGDLTKIRSSAVNQSALVEVAEEIDIGNFLLMSKSEEATGGRNKKSILEDSVEALIAAIYLDGNINKAEDFIKRYIFPKIKSLSKSPGLKDYKTRLQEIYAKKGKKILYTGFAEGPDHRKMFYSEVVVDDKIIGKGKGYSKKSAEQDAAQHALNSL